MDAPVRWIIVSVGRLFFAPVVKICPLSALIDAGQWTVKESLRDVMNIAFSNTAILEISDGKYNRNNFKNAYWPKSAA